MVKSAHILGVIVSCLVLYSTGTPDTIRTYDLWYRKPMLYPAELQAQTHFYVSAFPS
jgi:hypothetical protein